MYIIIFIKNIVKMGVDICKKNFCIDADYLDSKKQSNNILSTNMINNINNNNSENHQVIDSRNYITINKNNIIILSDYSKKFFHTKIDDIMNIEKEDYLKKIILIQRFFRKYIKLRKKSINFNQSSIVIPHLFNNKYKNSQKSFDTLFFRAASKEQFIYSSKLTKKSDLYNKYAPFNLITKKHIKYKYYGYLKKSKEFPNKNIKSGFGITKYVDGSVLTGNFLNNKANGICLYQDKMNGDFIGEYEDDIPNGFGIYKNEGKITYGYFHENYLEEIGFEEADDNTKYFGEYKQSEKSGIGKFIFNDGTIYEGEWENNSINGYGIISYPDNKVYMGHLDEGIMEGYGEFFWKTTPDCLKRYIGEYHNDKREGFGVFIWTVTPMIEAYVGFWKEGKMDGLGIKIENENYMYGIWKDKKREVPLKGAKFFSQYIKNEDINKIKILKMKKNKLKEMILKLALIQC